MKKLSILLTAAAVALGFASCSEDRDPVYQVPTTFVLNTPAMQSQFIDLTEKGTLELVASQPDYGYSAVTQYSAEVSLDPDFATFTEIAATSATSTMARFCVSQNDVCLAMLSLKNVTDEETFAETFGDNYVKVYFRAVAQLKGVESSRIVSNVVSYDNLKPYFAIEMPGFIYLVGAPEGWAGPTESNADHYAPWRLFEPADGIGTKIYSGVFDIPAGQAMFRFYTALTGWDADSYGYMVDDNATDFPEFTDGSFTSALVAGKGSFSFPNWVGGKMTIIVDLSDENNMTVTCMAGEHSLVATKYIYLVGSISGWQAPGTDNEEHYKNWRLADSTGDGIYTGSFDVPAGELSFRFALSLTDEGWDNPTQIGAGVADQNNNYTFSNGTFSGPYVSGKGNWTFNIDAASTIDIAVDTNSETVTYTLH